MGRNATGEKRDSILRVRITDELDERITEAMKSADWTGTKDQFTALLVKRGLEIEEVAQQAAAAARSQYIQGVYSKKLDGEWARGDSKKTSKGA